MKLAREHDRFPSLRDVVSAEAAIRQSVRATPLERSDRLSEIAGGPVYLKLECLQRSGSFKLRGALNAVATMESRRRARGLVTASAGNHGLGLALAARERDVPCTVFIPESAPVVKRARIAEVGASVRLVRSDYDAAHREAVAHASATGGSYVDACASTAVVAGQGTVALEVFTALPDAGTFLVPVGGGGLIGGVGVVARAMRPRARVIGVQSERTAAMHASLEGGQVQPADMGPTLCDGLSGSVEDWNVKLVRGVVDDVVLVSEEDVAAAMRRLYWEEGVVAEGSAAVGAAAIYAGRVRELPGPVVVLVTGGNVDPSLLAHLLREPT